MNCLKIWSSSFYSFFSTFYSSRTPLMATFIDVTEVYISAEAILHTCSSKNLFWKYWQIYWRTPTPKCVLNKVALQLYWNHTSTCVLCRKFSAYFQNRFSEEQLWGTASVKACYIFRVYYIIQSRFKSPLFGLLVFFAFFRNKILRNLRRHFRVRKIFSQRQLCT